MGVNKVALVGATGNIGPAVHKALLDADFEVVILTREGSSSTDSLPSHPKQTIVKVNYADVDSLASAFKGIDAVVSNVASHALLSQKIIIDAAVKEGVKRYLPSDFGSDLSIEFCRQVPFNAPKVEIHKYLEEKAKSHPDFSWTSVSCGPFFDWSLKFGLIGNMKTREATLWDGGDQKFSTTTEASVGKAVVGILKNPEATKNRIVRVSDTAISQNEIYGIAKEIDGREWTTTPGDTAESYQRGMEELQKPEPNIMTAVISQLMRMIFSSAADPDFEHMKDNDKIGLPTMTKEQVRDVIASALQ